MCGRLDGASKITSSGSCHGSALHVCMRSGSVDGIAARPCNRPLAVPIGTTVVPIGTSDLRQGSLYFAAGPLVVRAGMHTAAALCAVQRYGWIVFRYLVLGETSRDV